MARGLIVVGVDGSSESRQALRWAVDEAVIRKAALLVVHAWWALPELEAGAPGSDAAPQPISDGEAKRFIDEFVEQALGPDPAKVEIDTLPVQGVTAAHALLDAASQADLLVVGSRGLGGFKGLLLGSVSQKCVRDATCPVVVVPGEPSRPPGESDAGP
jgi:nucleotide-binding universal stress UspA family protein